MYSTRTPLQNNLLPTRCPNCGVQAVRRLGCTIQHSHFTFNFVLSPVQYGIPRRPLKRATQELKAAVPNQHVKILFARGSPTGTTSIVPTNRRGTSKLSYVFPRRFSCSAALSSTLNKKPTGKGNNGKEKGFPLFSPVFDCLH